MRREPAGLRGHDRRRRALLAALAALVLGQAATAQTAGDAAAAATIPPDADDATVIDAVASYLEGIDTLRADFTQFAPSGESATGVLWIQRPGRLRIDYDPPSQILLVATDWRLVYYDSAIEQMSTIPLAETPLGFILAERVDLAGDVEVIDIEHTGPSVVLRVVRRDAADQGLVELWFAREPVALERWTVTDPQGMRTTVVLESLRTDLEADPSLFFAPNPEIFGWPQ